MHQNPPLVATRLVAVRNHLLQAANLLLEAGLKETPAEKLGKIAAANQTIRLAVADLEETERVLVATINAKNALEQE